MSKSPMVIVTWTNKTAVWRVVVKPGRDNNVLAVCEAQHQDATGELAWSNVTNSQSDEMVRMALLWLATGKVEAHQEAAGRLAGMMVIDLGDQTRK